MSDIKTKFRLRRDIFLPWEMFESKAFSKLSASQIRTLIRFLQKREWITEGTGKKKRRIFKNNGLPFTYSEAHEVLGIGDTQFSTNIRKLMEVGFIDLDHPGGAGRGRGLVLQAGKVARKEGTAPESRILGEGRGVVRSGEDMKMHPGYALMHNTLEEVKAIITDETLNDPAFKIHLAKCALDTYENERKKMNITEDVHNDPRD